MVFLYVLVFILLGVVVVNVYKFSVVVVVIVCNIDRLDFIVVIFKLGECVCESKCYGVSVLF